MLVSTAMRLRRKIKAQSLLSTSLTVPSTLTRQSVWPSNVIDPLCRRILFLCIQIQIRGVVIGDAFGAAKARLAGNRGSPPWRNKYCSDVRLATLPEVLIMLYGVPVP